MAGSRHISESEAKRIWYLHERGVKPSDIAVAIDRNVNSVYRVVDIFQKTAGKEFEAVEERYGKTNGNLLQLAKAHFGLEPQQEESSQPKSTPAHDNTIKYLADVLTELRRNNELLGRLLAVWEGEA